VDEINRTPPRTQSALLEPMEERQVTVDGVTHVLPAPYLVIATENPVEQHGTYPLPEGQLDRFALSVRVDYPDEEGAKALVHRQLRRHPLRDLAPVLEPDEVVEAQRQVREVHIDDKIVAYAVALATATRRAPDVALGASPRASVWLVRTAQARAIGLGRDYVLPDDVKALAEPVLAHRIVPKVRAGSGVARQVVRRVLDEVPVPLHAATVG
jgi:MoxR-like ATPase